MPAIVVCAACQTKMKVPEATTAKALRCPKCKGAVPLTLSNGMVKKDPPKPAAPPPPKPDEFEVNEAVDEEEKEFEVNEAADDELEVNEAVDEEESEDDDSFLAQLGFAKVDDPYKKGGL